jgi:capsular exopolysaccharide synthesis family protein
MLIEPVTAEGRLAKLSVLAQSGVGISTNDISRLGDSDLVDYETQIRVLKSPKLMEPLIKELQSRYPDINYSKLLETLSISRITYELDGKKLGTKLLDVVYQDPDTEKINYVLTRLADTFLNYSLQDRLTGLNQGISFIESQIPEVQQKVNSLQFQMQQLREQYNMTTPELAAKNLGDQANYLESERLKALSELSQTQGAYAQIVQDLNRGNPTSVLAREWQTYQGLLGQLQSIDGQIAVASGQFLEDSPPIQALRDQRSKTLIAMEEQGRTVQQTIANRMGELDARVAGISRQQGEVNQRVSVFADVVRRYSDIERDLTIATDSLKQILSKREALKLDSSQRQIPWEMVSPPEVWLDKKGKPIPVEAQKTSRTLAIVVVLSMLFGVGIGFIVEIMNTVFHTAEEVRGATKLRLLGTIPFDQELKKRQRKFKRLASLLELAKKKEPNIEKAEQAVEQSQATESPYFLEAFRSLYTNIRLLSANNPIQSLVISSAVPGDGKSTVATQLARTAASIGVRVLLVDGDLRNPQIHQVVGLSNQRGLSDAIATDISLNDVIQVSPTDENLFVLTGGRYNADPIKLLSSDKMQYLMEQFQAFFDLVIYDSPPLVGLSDAPILEANTDGLILVVSLAKTDRAMVKRALDGLKVSGASVLGVVANGFKTKMPKSYSTYGNNYRRPKKEQEVNL